MKLIPALLFVLLAAAWTAAHPSQDDPAPAQPVTVFLLRHAETAASTKTARDPELSEAGRARAEAVARLLGHAGVTHLFSSEFQRTQATLGPLAEVTELEIEVVSAAEGEAQAAALRALPSGSVAVVAGHSNTVPALALLLGGEVEELEDHPRYGPVFNHDSYDRMIQVILPAAEGTAPRAIELRYGE